MSCVFANLGANRFGHLETAHFAREECLARLHGAAGSSVGGKLGGMLGKAAGVVSGGAVPGMASCEMCGKKLG